MIFFAVAVVVSGCQSLSGGSATDAAPYFTSSRLSGLSACHTSDQVLVTQITDNTIAPVFVRPSSQQLTFAMLDDAQGEAVTCFPYDERILLQRFSARDSGNHLLVYQPDGQILDITPGVGIQARFLGWDNDGRYFYVAQISPGHDAEQIYRYRADNYQHSKIYDNANNLTIRGISGNGRFAVSEYHPGVPDGRIVIADLTYPEARQVPLKLSAEHRHVSPLGFVGRELIFISDARSRSAQAWRFNLQTHDVAPLTNFDGAVNAMAVSPDKLVFEIIEQGISRLVLTNKNGQLLAQPPWPSGNLSAPVFSRDGGQLYFYHSSDTHQPAPMHLNMVSMTMSDVPASKSLPGSLIRGTRVWLDSSQGQVPATLFKPRHTTQPVPAMVLAHDGLHSHYQRQYNPQVQHLTSSGIAVLAVDYHGSEGYGSDYQHSTVRQHGQRDTRDIITAGQYLAGQDWVNPRQIGVMGTGYGGFLSLSAVTQTTLFSAAVSFHGMVDWLQYLQTIPPSMADYARFMRYEMGDPATQASQLQQISPLYQTEHISTPVMLVQGGRDPQVSEMQTRRLAEQLARQGVPGHYLLFADEAHGLSLADHQIDAQQRLLTFLHQLWRI
ncbi:S9 family peptidase [Salinimonas lutimaris]|uniref:S9 family peptidase n=1 Tax=Salinimonas lutimaris TaxID=914153 RepID=UPI00158639BE|nr:prolyl oligopeptidase family serine peptidase [Salinimonas lutimaris]